MPLMKVAIIETMATIVEKHGVDLEECSKVIKIKLIIHVLLISLSRSSYCVYYKTNNLPLPIQF